MKPPAQQAAAGPGRPEIHRARATPPLAVREHPLLRGLRAVSADFLPKAAGFVCRQPEGSDEAVLVYCIRGGGWCELGGRLHTVRAGEVLVIPPHTPHAYGAHASNPWTFHRARAAGEKVPVYLRELGTSPTAPVLEVGEDLQLTLLFNEVARALERGPGWVNLLHASHALGHLLALLIRHRRERRRPVSDAAQKVAQSILYMSEHLDEPLRVTALAALANVSPAHFTVLFKEQTGCSPREYLHLLRMHHACQWLRATDLSVKEIAARLGYRDPFHFSRQFKGFQGVAPRHFRGG